jgi:hypothetical protein
LNKKTSRGRGYENIQVWGILPGRGKSKYKGRITSGAQRTARRPVGLEQKERVGGEAGSRKGKEIQISEGFCSSW